MTSQRMTIRLRTEEAQRLDSMWRNNETLGFENASEFIRMLIAREWNRRQGAKTRCEDYETARRVGRPLDCQNPCNKPADTLPPVVAALVAGVIDALPK